MNSDEGAEEESRELYARQTLSGTYKTFLRGEQLDSSYGQDEGEDEASDVTVEFVDEIEERLPGAQHVSAR
jgi:hypothetical protein